MDNFAPKGGGFRDVCIILALLAVFLLPSFNARDLWNPDEPRYMEVGREMVLRNDYLVPHLNGEVYPDKPPMFFWLVAGAYKAGFGFNSGRVVAALATMGTVFLTYFIGRRFLPAPGGLLAAATTLTAMLFLITSKTGVVDPLLAFMTMAAIACGLRALDSTARCRGLWWLACYFAVGLAVLTKGPVGIIIPAVTFLAYSLLSRGKVRGGWIHLAGAILLLAIVGAWLIPACIKAGPEYMKNILFKQNIVRAGDSYSHKAPFYYYLVQSPGMFMPWALLFIPAVASAVRDWRRARETSACLGLGWFVGVFLFFTLMSGKRAGYLMPLFPAFGLLMARYFLETMRGEFIWPKAHKVFAAATYIFFAAVAVVSGAGVLIADKLPLLFYHKHPETARQMAQEVAKLLPGMVGWVLLAVAVILALVAVGWKVVIRGGKTRWLPATIVALVLVLSLTADGVVIPRVNTFKSGKEFSMLALPYMNSADETYMYKKSFSGVYNLYTGRISIPVLEKAEDLKEALGASKKIAVIGRDEELAKALGGDSYQFGYIPVTERIGHRKMYLLLNWDPTKE